MELLLFKKVGEILYCMNDWSNSQGGLFRGVIIININIINHLYAGSLQIYT